MTLGVHNLAMQLDGLTFLPLSGSPDADDPFGNYQDPPNSGLPTPDAEAGILMHGAWSEALERILIASRRRGVVVLVGERGSGRSTLLRVVGQELGSTGRSVKWWDGSRVFSGGADVAIVDDVEKLPLRAAAAMLRDARVIIAAGSLASAHALNVRRRRSTIVVLRNLGPADVKPFLVARDGSRPGGLVLESSAYKQLFVHSRGNPALLLHLRNTAEFLAQLENTDHVGARHVDAAARSWSEIDLSDELGEVESGDLDWGHPLPASGRVAEGRFRSVRVIAALATTAVLVSSFVPSQVAPDRLEPQRPLLVAEALPRAQFSTSPTEALGTLSAASEAPPAAKKADVAPGSLDASIPARVAAPAVPFPEPAVSPRPDPSVSARPDPSVSPRPASNTVTTSALTGLPTGATVDIAPVAQRPMQSVPVSKPPTRLEGAPPLLASNAVPVSRADRDAAPATRPTDDGVAVAPQAQATPRSDAAAGAGAEVATVTTTAEAFGRSEARNSALSSTHVSLTFTPGDKAAQDRGLRLARVLRLKGYDVADPVPAAADGPVGRVDYFFGNDAGAARDLVAYLGGDFGNGMLAPSQAQPRRPGALRIVLPRGNGRPWLPSQISTRTGQVAWTPERQAEDRPAMGSEKPPFSVARD